MKQCKLAMVLNTKRVTSNWNRSMALKFTAEVAEDEEEEDEEEDDDEEAVLEEDEVLAALGPLRCGVDDPLEEELEDGTLKKEEKNEGGIDKYSRINRVAIGKENKLAINASKKLDVSICNDSYHYQ